MNLNKFSWHQILPPELGDAGMHLMHDGPSGETYAAVTVMRGEPWLASLNLNLHRDTTKVRSVPCVSEMEAIQAVECWLEDLFAGSQP